MKAQGNLEEAIRIYDRLIELDPKSPLAYDRVIALHASGKPVDTADLHKVIDLDPESADLHLDVGLILAGQNKSAQAIVYLRKAIDLDENSAKAHYHLGNALYLQGKVDEAITNYRRAIEIAPEFANVYVNLGAALYDQKQLEEAITNYRKAIEINPKHAKAYNNLANALSAQGKVDDAITCYRKAIELDPKSANANASLGETLAKKAWDLANHADLKVRDCVGALELSKEAVEFAPRSAAAWQYLGWVQYRAGNWESSIEALENSCRLQEGGTGDAFQWLFLAMAHWQLDHKEHSRKWYDKAIQVERVWPEILRDIRAEAEGLMGVNETMK